MTDEGKKGCQKNLGYVFKKMMGLRNFMGGKKIFRGNKLL